MAENAVDGGSLAGLDRGLLAEAQRHLEGASEVETLNAALEQFVEEWRERRGRAFDRLQALADEGGFDFAAIDEADR
ncbi:DUF2191 domain-containing protein [Dactylosporangium sp. NPDC049525]|uniref:DUF2191 domain-containing protein n=1 Tax=Dactylosporangium sp. NPDC049525 TaxID=3154730 RepID=UPI003420F5F2